MRRIARGLLDVRKFGLGAVARHFQAETPVNVPDVGRMWVRGRNSDFATVKQVFDSREYDTTFCSALDDRLQMRYREILAAGQRPIIVDAGANIGAASLWFSAKYPEAVVAAVEPDSNNLRILHKNVAGNRNIVVIEGAIGSEPGFVTTNENDGDMGWATQTTRADAGKPVLTMEDVFKASGNGQPLIVKIDIEGFESDLFASNLDWLERTPALIIEPHDWMMPGKMTSLTFQKALAARSFELFIRGENLIYARP